MPIQLAARHSSVSKIGYTIDVPIVENHATTQQSKIGPSGSTVGPGLDRRSKRR